MGSVLLSFGEPEKPRRVSMKLPAFLPWQKGKAGFAFVRQKVAHRFAPRNMIRMKGSVRAASLTLSGSGDKCLGTMEKHGKRQDRTSQDRKVRDVEPLVYGSLDLRSAYDDHVDGARMNKSLKRPVMHALVQFPTQIKINTKNEQKMLDLAVKFINDSHGGDAVFAARLDRDEEGRHNVDVFYAPKYLKKTKSRGEEIWISTTKHGKELCEKHRDEIVTRHRDGEFTTGPRQVGIALQEEFHQFMARHGVNLQARQKKDLPGPDRDSPEVYKAKMEQKKRLAAEKKSKALSKAIVKLHGRLDEVRDLIPSKLMALVDALHRRESGRPIDPAVRVGQDPSRGLDDPAPKRNDEADPDPSAGYAP